VIRLCLIDDQTIVREGLKSLLALSPDFEVVADAADGEEAIRIITREQPDVVLLDLRMPLLDGIGVLQRLRDLGTLPPTLILTTFDDDRMLFDAVRAGAKGWLLKDVSLERLSSAIRTLAAGGTCLDPAITERILQALAKNATTFEASELPDPLTDRELTVLRFLAGGYSNREISELLQIGEGTVKNHISSVLSKLGVRDRTRAVLRAIDLGVL
jgi:DNA-binding NarL/FixJ family response regulator